MLFVSMCFAALTFEIRSRCISVPENVQTLVWWISLIAAFWMSRNMILIWLSSSDFSFHVLWAYFEWAPFHPLHPFYTKCLLLLSFSEFHFTCIWIKWELADLFFFMMTHVWMDKKWESWLWILKTLFLWIVEILLWFLSQYHFVFCFFLMRQLENKLGLLTFPNLLPITNSCKSFWWGHFPLGK